MFFDLDPKGDEIYQAGPGILRVTFEAPRFGKAPNGNPKETNAKGILRGTYEAPSTLHSVADSRGPCIKRQFQETPIVLNLGVLMVGGELQFVLQIWRKRGIQGIAGQIIFYGLEDPVAVLRSDVFHKS